MAVKQQVFRCIEISTLAAVIVVVWIVMFLPVAVYYVPRADRSSNDSPSVNEPQNLTTINQNSQERNHTSLPICPDDFFADSATSPALCSPSCSSWTMFGRSEEVATITIIGIATVTGILTTIVIIILSFTCFKRMLTFPSILVLYQDIIVSVHGVNVLVGFGDRRLFCTSEDLVETYNSVASPYCTISGIVSNYMVLPLTVWIAIQVSYTILAVYAPVYFKQFKEKKWRRHILHLVSVLAGIASLLFPSLLTLGVGGYSSLDTKFPPIVCFAKDRDITVYIFLIPIGVLIATIITELILIFHFLLRNTCTKKTSKDLKKAEVKVIIICCLYVILGLGASLAYAVASSSIYELKSELMDYFECKSTMITYNPLAESEEEMLCERSGFERYVSPASKIFGYSTLALYPAITLIYFLRKKRKPQLDAKHAFNNNSCGTSSKSLNLTGL